MEREQWDFYFMHHCLKGHTTHNKKAIDSYNFCEGSCKWWFWQVVSSSSLSWRLECPQVISCKGEAEVMTLRDVIILFAITAGGTGHFLLCLHDVIILFATLVILLGARGSDSSHASDSLHPLQSSSKFRHVIQSSPTLTSPNPFLPITLLPLSSSSWRR